jgi:hypothetical protein
MVMVMLMLMLMQCSCKQLKENRHSLAPPPYSIFIPFFTSHHRAILLKILLVLVLRIGFIRRKDWSKRCFGRWNGQGGRILVYIDQTKMRYMVTNWLIKWAGPAGYICLPCEVYVAVGQATGVYSIYVHAIIIIKALSLWASLMRAWWSDPYDSDPGIILSWWPPLALLWEGSDLTRPSLLTATCIHSVVFAKPVDRSSTWHVMGGIAIRAVLC